MVYNIKNIHYIETGLTSKLPPNLSFWWCAYLKIIIISRSLERKASKEKVSEKKIIYQKPIDTCYNGMYKSFEYIYIMYIDTV